MGKQKNFLLVCLCLLVIVNCIGCKKEEPKNEALVSLAENGMKKVNAPQGCEIISNPADFTPVKEDQSYHFEADDSSLDVVCGLVDTGTNMFYLSDGCLHYYNKEDNKCGLLCSKPECTHVMEDLNSCSANMRGFHGLVYNKGALYSVDASEIQLVKVTLDGTERSVIGELCTVPEEEVKQRDDASFSINWMIHRGYIYYCYKLYSGMTEDIYYLNGSNCLYRMPIDGSSEPECIMPFVCEGISAYTILKGYGSYVYMNIPEKGKESGYLYRYNIESGKVEKLEMLGDDMRGYTVRNGNIYYSCFHEPEKIYCYDESVGIPQLFFTIEEDEKHRCVPWIYSDEDNIYVAYYEGDIVKGMFMFDWQGNVTADVLWRNLEDEVAVRGSFCGTSDDRLYFLRRKGEERNPWIQAWDFYTITYYIEKEDLADGKYEIHEAEK